MSARARSSLLFAALAPALLGCGLLTGLGDVELDPSIVCDGGVCACPEGFADCDDTGLVCESDLRTRSEHCGACGHSCGGGTCRDGTCEPTAVFVSTSTFAYYCATSGDHVYVPDAEGVLIDVTLGGGAAPAAPVKGLGTGAALFEDTLFYSGYVDDEWQIFQGPRGDPSSHEVLFKGSWLPAGEALSVVGATKGHVFVTEELDQGYLFRLPRAQPASATVVVDAYWAAALLPDRAYFSGSFQGAFEGIYMIRDGDDAPTEIVPGSDILFLMPGLAGDLDRVYYTTYWYPDSEIQIWEVGVEDKTPRMIHKLAAAYNDVAMAMDASYLYLTAEVSGEMALYRFDRAAPGATPLNLASVGAFNRVYSVDPGLYWVSDVLGQEYDIFVGYTLEGGVLNYLAKPLD